jgi:hypothetical protein
MSSLVPVPIQSNTNTVYSASDSQTLVFKYPNKAGNTLVLSGWGTGTPGVTDNAAAHGGASNNTWQLLKSDLGTFFFVAYNCQPTTSPITVTLSVPGSLYTCITSLFEVSGVNALDQSQTGTGTTGANPYPYVGPSITTVEANSIAFALMQILPQVNCPLLSPWLNICGATLVEGVGYRVLTSTGTYNATVNGTGSGQAGNGIIFNLYYNPGSPTISGLSFAKTDTSIIATWTTSTPEDSNLTCGVKGSIGGSLPFGLTHQAIVTGLLPSTQYSCVVTSGLTSSTPQNVTTNPAQARILISSATNGSPTKTPCAGDSVFTFVSNDNVTYNTMNDGFGWTTPNAGANMQVDKITNESTFAGSTVNLLSAYGSQGTTNGTDGPGGIALATKTSGIFGMLGNLYLFVNRDVYPNVTYPDQPCYFGNVIKSVDKGVTWNNWQNPVATATTGIQPVLGASSYQFASANYGWATPIRYAADDGTLGYLTAGNGIDGADGFVYATFLNLDLYDNSSIYLMRVPRVQFDAQTTTAFQYWTGPTSPTPADFVNDSNWSASDASKTAIYAVANQTSWPEITFIPILNSYLLLTFYMVNSPVNGSTETYWEFSTGPTPAGPWTNFFSQHNTPSGYYGVSAIHRDVFSNTLSNNIPVRIIYSGDWGVNILTYYFPTYSTLTLTTNAYNVSGNAGVAGATVSDGTNSVTADGLGYYTLPGLANGSYTITPSKTGYTFSPVNASEAVNDLDITGVSFTATQTPTGGGSGSYMQAFRGFVNKRGVN